MSAAGGTSWATGDPFRAAGGRRGWNRQRQDMAEIRRLEVVRLLRKVGSGRGSQVTIARALGVSESTVSRDVRAVFAMTGQSRCPCCGSVVPEEDLPYPPRSNRKPSSAKADTGR